ncbi:MULTISPECIES: kynureninase [unclassified Rathayibacter]|uniref:kynureninase n=1 Tax=unclassified Rathayibacter TaxID=2609250 RepID=UPI0006FD859B|nr:MULTISPECIES: aminotransferase class V-fold PLP-dependent enzyme [unclassified Rathayibacter]KQQ05770.1 kynureninase [Rathayibacter sp. Leaf294]KQS13628.1 kynureninase [Rathayibacter sp. Leaf185]
MTATGTLTTAAELDRLDPLSSYRSRFLGADDPALPAYVDGNSLGRPLADLPARYAAFVEKSWGHRLIRGWDDSWFELPLALGDRLGSAVLGAGPGQVVVGDSTTVSLYKLIRTALHARPGRSEIVIDRGNFPTDRFVVEGIAAETGASIRWIETELGGGVAPDDVRSVVGADTAVVVLSQVAYRSGFAADVPAITALVHDAGALVLWDLCHSVGVLPIELDEWGVDLATGCTYKYLNGGPGAPAFLYVRRDLISTSVQPIWGWMGVKDSFRMGESYDPADGIRRFVSGTPPIVGMIAMQSMLDLIEEAGLPAIHAKSLALTAFAVELFDEHLAPLGVTLSTTRLSERRGGHITVDHPAFAAMVPVLWERGVIPDFRAPSGLRLGLSPLSTSFAEVEIVVLAVRDLLAQESS